MGLFDSVSNTIFGESPDTKETTLGTLSPEQEKLLKDLIGNLQGGLGNVQQGGVSLESLEQQALAGLEQFAKPGGESKSLPAADDFLTNLFELGGSQDRADEFFRTNIADPLQTNLQEEIGNIGSRFGGQFFGGERRQAETDLREDFADALVAGKAGTSLELLKLATEGAGQVPGLETARAVRPTTLAGIGEFGGLRRRSSQDEEARIIDDLLALLGIQSKENIVTVEGGSTGVLSGFAQGFGQGFGGTF